MSFVAFQFLSRLEIKDTDPRAYLLKGIAHENLKQFDSAKENYDLAILINPDYTEAYLNRGNLYIQTKEYEQALLDFNKAKYLNPFDKRVSQQLAKVIQIMEPPARQS